MIKYTKIFITLLLAIIVFQAGAQQTTANTSSPYSRYGLGDVSSLALPQNTGMGGLGAAVNNFSGYFNINPVNPASYGAIGLTVIDIGLYGTSTTLNQTGQAKQTNGNFRLDHIAFAFPVSKHSALSFGMQPYTQLGYNYKTTQNNFGTGSSADSNAVNYIYSGNGGLTKAYLGYGFGIGKHLLLGANVSYIFGKLQQYSSTEIPGLFGTLNSRVEDSYSTGGLNYDYGGQYTIDLTTTKHIILGYSASANSKLTTQHSHLISQYNYDDSGNENPALDTLLYVKDPKAKIQLPQINHFGLTFVNDNKYLIGAEYTMANWSTLSIDGVNQGLQDSKTYNIGGQITPNANALSNYWATVDYRLGFIYDQSYIDVNDATNNTSTNIKSYAFTFGLGLPLRPSSDHNAFYKINFAAEVGRRGTLDNGLVKENYVNLHLSFTLNDRWFVKYKLN
jgi:hypothetical protein